MASAVHRITSKGQVTIPIELLREMDLEAGDGVVFSRRGNQIVLESAEHLIDEVFGSLAEPGRVTDNSAESISEEKRLIADAIAKWADVSGDDRP